MSMVDFIPDEVEVPEQAAPFARLTEWASPALPNIAAELTDAAIAEIGMRVCRHYDIDNSSRTDWLTQAEDALNMAMQRTQQKQYPWPRASNVLFPLITEAADQFAARAYPAIINNKNVVKGLVYGEDKGVPELDPETGGPMQNPETGEPVWQIPPGAKRRRADRIGEHMSWQLLEEQPEWESDTDTMLAILAIVGCEFRKTYYDPAMGRNVSCRISAKNLVINYWAKSMQTAPRITERIYLYPYEIKEKQASGQFIHVDFGLSQEENANSDEDAPHLFLEQHRRLDLDGDGYGEPYVVTVHHQSQRVVRIVACYDPEDIITTDTQTIVRIPAIEYYTKYDFLPNKEGGIYGQGLAHNLLPINRSVNTTLNMLIDAGHLQNVGGGFIGKGMSLHSGMFKFQPGEYKPINAMGSAVRDSIVHLDHKGPSPVLFSLLGMLVEAGKSISSVKDVMTGELKAQTMSPTVFMAMIEQGLKVFTAIYKRIFRSLKSEFDKLYRLNRVYMEQQTSYRQGDMWKPIERADYDSRTGVEPAVDPSMVVDSQKMARAEFLGAFKDDPLMNGEEIRRRMLDAASIPDIDAVLQSKPPPNAEITARMAELELRRIETKARAIYNMAGAVKMLAEADEKVANEFNTWAATHLQLLQGEIDGAENKPGAMGDVEAAPGNGAVPAIP